jgi:IclR family mhp operon transcriptional activator
MTGETGKRGAIRAISRGIAVLQAVNRAGSTTMMDIATQSGVPYPTACRIVQTLLEDGMIEREPGRKRYRPTALVQTLSVGYQIEDRLVTAARAHIVALTQKVTWPVSVSTRVGANMMVRDSTHSLTPLTFHVYYPGYTLPMLESSSGKAYLAFCPGDERAALLSTFQGSDNAIDGLPMRLADIPKLLDLIRQNGYATHRRTRHTENPGKTSSISTPVFAGEHLIGTLTLIFFASAMTMETAIAQFAEALKETAKAVSAALETRAH